MAAEKDLFQCDFCDATFTLEENLPKHILSIHKSIIEGQTQPFVNQSKVFVGKILVGKNVLSSM